MIGEAWGAQFQHAFNRSAVYLLVLDCKFIAYYPTTLRDLQDQGFFFFAGEDFAQYVKEGIFAWLKI